MVLASKKNLVTIGRVNYGNIETLKCSTVSLVSAKSHQIWVIWEEIKVKDGCVFDLLVDSVANRLVHSVAHLREEFLLECVRF